MPLFLSKVRAFVLLKRGQKNIASGKTAKGIELLEKAASFLPKWAPLHLHLALGYAGIDDLDRAKDEINIAIDLGSKKNTFRLFLGQILFERREHAQAKCVLQEALKQDIDNRLIQGYLALAFLADGDHSQCQKLISEKRVSENTDFQISFLLALEERLRGVFKGSQSYPVAEKKSGDKIKSAGICKKFKVSSLVESAYGEIEKKNYEHALDALIQASLMDSNNPDIFAYIGEVYILLKNYDKAIEAFEKRKSIICEKALAQDNLSKYVTGYYGKILFEKRDVNCALTTLEEAVDKGAKEPEIFYTLGLVYWSIGQKSKSKKAFYEIDPLDPNFYYNKIKELLSMLETQNSKQPDA